MLLLPFWTYLLQEFSYIVHRKFKNYSEKVEWNYELFVRHKNQASNYTFLLMSQEIPKMDRIQCFTNDMIQFLEDHNFQGADLLWNSFEIWKSGKSEEEIESFLFFCFVEYRTFFLHWRKCERKK